MKFRLLLFWLKTKWSNYEAFFALLFLSSLFVSPQFFSATASRASDSYRKITWHFHLPLSFPTHKKRWALLSYIHFVLTKRQIAVYLNSTEQIQLIQLQNEVTLQSIAMHDGYGRCFHFWLWNWIRLTISGKFLVLIFGTMTMMAMMPRGKNSYAIDINI